MPTIREIIIEAYGEEEAYSVTDYTCYDCPIVRECPYVFNQLNINLDGEEGRCVAEEFSGLNLSPSDIDEILHPEDYQ